MKKTCPFPAPAQEDRRPRNATHYAGMRKNRTFGHHLPLLLVEDVTEEAGAGLDRPQQGAQETLAELSYRTHVETGLDASRELEVSVKLDTGRNRARGEKKGKKGGRAR